MVRLTFLKFTEGNFFKTSTLVEAVLQIFRVQPEACILVCAPSNPATDTLAVRMKDRLMQNEMLRLNNPHRTFAEVPDAIKPYCCRLSRLYHDFFLGLRLLHRRGAQWFLDPSLEEINGIQGSCMFLSGRKYTAQSTMREHGTNGNGR